MPVRKFGSSATVDTLDLERGDVVVMSMKRRSAFSSSFRSGLPRETSVPEIKISMAADKQVDRGSTSANDEAVDANRMSPKFS